MLAITSLAPGNVQRQKQAMRSWKDVGYQVVSVNAQKEIDQLQSFFDVQFVPTALHNKQLFGKPYVRITALLQCLQHSDHEYGLIINADNFIYDSGGITATLPSLADNGIIAMNRRDFDEDINTSKPFMWGYDAFFMKRDLAQQFPDTQLCLGQCHWDYWLPYVALRNGLWVQRCTEPYLYHQKHPNNWSEEMHEQTASLLMEETGLQFDTPKQLNTYLRDYFDKECFDATISNPLVTHA